MKVIYQNKKQNAVKIPGCPAEVCTGEQKIAYNFAFARQDIVKYNLDQAETEFLKAEVLRHFVRTLTKEAESIENISKRFNIDLIFCALGAGLEKYINGNSHIFTSYEQIGECFSLDGLKQI